MEKLELHVTQEDIDKAGEDCTNCPIAQALLRKFPECDPWVSSTMEINFSVHGQTVRLPHSYESLHFVGTYDEQGPSAVQPCTLVFTAGPLHV